MVWGPARLQRNPQLWIEEPLRELSIGGHKHVVQDNWDGTNPIFCGSFSLFPLSSATFLKEGITRGVTSTDTWGTVLTPPGHYWVWREVTVGWPSLPWQVPTLHTQSTRVPRHHCPYVIRLPWPPPLIIPEFRNFDIDTMSWHLLPWVLTQDTIQLICSKVTVSS